MDSRRLLTVRWLVVGALLASGAGCATGNGVADGTDPVEDAGFDKKNDAGEEADAGFVEDAGFTSDVFIMKDAGAEDAGDPDGGMVDPPDVGADAGARDVPTADSGMDAGPRDAGVADAGPRDTGVIDSGPRDTGPVDAGTPDTGPRDAGTPDVGTPDTGTPDVGTPDTGPACTPTMETVNGRDDDCDGLVDEGFSANTPALSLACMGTGLILSLGDSEVDDGGSTRNGDGFEVFCVNGISRFCITNEACPWRGGAPAVDDGRNCSSAGLSATPRFGVPYFMAYLTRRYLVFDGVPIDYFFCPPDGHVSFRTSYF